MWDKALREIKYRKWYPPIAIATGIFVLVAGGWVLFGRSLSQRPNLNDLPLPTPEESISPAAVRSPAAMPTPLPTVSLPATQPANPQTGQAIAQRQGVLRVSNLTEHPVRIALLQKKSAAQFNQGGDRYEPPAHWDFEPGEGGDRGLLLSLPNRSLQLQSGDILTAFAQDGSRRYWGPYVVGETPFPKWDTPTAEWQLTLQPE